MWTVIAEVVFLYLAATFCFDAVHFGLHAAHRRGWAIGAWHDAHHRFLGPTLKFDDAFARENFLHHRTGEFATQLVGTALGFLVLDPWPVVGTLLIFTGSFAVGIFLDGKDSNHREADQLPAPLGAIFVGFPYHALHHVFPDRYFGSVTTLFDRLFGTGCQLAGRTVLLTGATGAFGAPLKALLEREGAIVTALAHRDFARADAALAAADILVLAHGSKGRDAMAANCDASVELIERFRAAGQRRLVRPEVWAVGSEIEAHPAFGAVDYAQSKRAFARHARGYFHDPALLYRHVVPSAFTSPMGKGLISGRLAAAWALFLIKRGCRYVPVSYTGIALLNYLKFAVRPSPLQRPRDQPKCS